MWLLTRGGFARRDRRAMRHLDQIQLLFTASPAYGHLLPLLPMVRAAMTAGHDVRLATGPSFCRSDAGALGAGVRRRPDVGRDRRGARPGEARRSQADDLDAQRLVSASVLFRPRRGPAPLPGLLDLAAR